MTVGDPYRTAAPVPDIVRVRCLRNGDRIPTLGAALLRWYCLDVTDDEAREVYRRGGSYVSLCGVAMRRHIEMELPAIRGRAVEVLELSEQDTRALPKVNFQAFGLWDA